MSSNNTILNTSKIERIFIYQIYKQSNIQRYILYLTHDEHKYKMRIKY